MVVSVEKRLELYERDKGLALRARAGDDSARNELVVLYRPLSLKLANRFKYYTLEDPDDLSQDALLRLMRRVKDYDPSRGSFMTFAYEVMLWEISDNVRDHKNKFGRLVSLYKAFGEDEEYLLSMIEDKATPRSNNSVPSDTKDLLRRHISVLTKKERVIVDEVLRDKSRSCIALELGKSKAYVDMHYDVALRRLRRSIEQSNDHKGVEYLVNSSSRH